MKAVPIILTVVIIGAASFVANRVIEDKTGVKTSIGYVVGGALIAGIVVVEFMVKKKSAE